MSSARWTRTNMERTAYGYETWTINEQNRRKLEATKMWRRLPTFSWIEMKSNIDIIKLKQVGRGTHNSVKHRKRKK